MSQRRHGLSEAKPVVVHRGNPYEVVKKGIIGEYQLVISADIIDEAVDKFRNKFKFPEENIEDFIDILITYCHIIDVTSKFDVVRDKKDNKIIECAFDGNADYIVTGDPDLLVLKEFKGIKIIKAKGFLDKIKDKE